VKTIRACARALVCLLFSASPVLANDYVCSDFRHVSREAIGFVAEWQGVVWNEEKYRDSGFHSALAENGGTVFLFSGPTPSERLIECLEISRQLTPGGVEVFNGAVSRLGTQSPPEVIERTSRLLPKEMRDEYREAFFPLLSVGETVVSGPWTTKVFATLFDEPDRSLDAIDVFLGQLSICGMRQDCREAFVEFVGE